MIFSVVEGLHAGGHALGLLAHAGGSGVGLFGQGGILRHAGFQIFDGAGNLRHAGALLARGGDDLAHVPGGGPSVHYARPRIIPPFCLEQFRVAIGALSLLASDTAEGNVKYLMAWMRCLDPNLHIHTMYIW